MKKQIFLVLFVIVSFKLSAKSLYLDPNVLEVVSQTKHNSVGPNTNFRATVFYGGEEGAVQIGVEKFQIGEYGSPDKILLQKKWVTSSLDGFKDLIDKIMKKSVEATYGCCRPSNLKWSKDHSLEFKLKYEDRIFNRGFDTVDGKKVDTAQYSHTEISTFQCSTSSLLKSSMLNAKCKRVKFQKVQKE